ncbi:putative Ig domain-containing protein [Spirosoma spitsbergense]|uniref:putative Ig domain-containing protein n=1 Tax=Spirosoma spitsbergense TaxID=431554 RepID=UPI003CCC1C26
MSTVTLTASPGGLSYIFSAGATQIGSTNQASVSTAGPYSVMVTSANGCTAMATTTVAGDQTAPSVSISAVPSLTITEVDATTLTANVSGGTSPFGYNWSTGASSNSIVTGTEGPYSVTVTGANGCSATASVTVSVIRPFSITGVTTLSCETISAGQRRVTFNPRYASQSNSPISFSVVNELAPTTNPGPYTLNLYTDNPVITLSATQSGANTRFAYNWLSACSSSTANTPPTVANPVSPQSATVGIGYTLSLANVFTDAETPNGLTLSVTGLPAGLNFVAPSTISGTPSMSGVSNVTVTATDPGSLSASTSFTITVNPAAGTPPPPTGTFSITGVQTISCEVLSAGERRLTFNPRYAGLNGAPVSFSVVNELAPTTNPGPYTLNLYTDNSVITLRAVQSGISSSFAYNWLSACSSSTANTAPTVANPVSPQSATVGVGYTLSLASVFTDAETPNQLTLLVSGLPAGLSFTAPSTISGTPSMSGVTSVLVRATDPGSLSASTSFSITVSPAGGTPPPATFSITGVQTISCEVLSAGQRRLTFNPQYGGLNGAPVSFSVVNELLPTTNPGPYTLNLYTDNPVIGLRAVQSGVSVSFSYGWLAGCNAGTRIAAEPMPLLQVRLLGNPVASKTVRVEIQGAESQAVWLRVQNLSGGVVDEQVIRRAASTETVELSLGTDGGIYLLHVSTGNQQRTLKVIKP